MSGIPSGLPALNIPTMDITGMIDYYIEILTNKNIEYKPVKYPKPNLEIDILSSQQDWAHILETGRGSLKLGPRMTIEGNTITITALPNGKGIEHVRKIIDKEILLDKIDMRDESGENICIVVEKVPHKQCDMKEIYKRLYTKLQSNVTYNLAFYDEEKIYVPCSFDKIVRTNLQYLIDVHHKRIAEELSQLLAKLEVLEIIEQMKKNNEVKNLVSFNYDEAVTHIASKYSCSDNTASKVLQKPLSYMTKEHQQEIIDLKDAIESLKNDQDDIFEFLIGKYKTLKKEIASATRNKFKPTKFIKA